MFISALVTRQRQHTHTNQSGVVPFQALSVAPPRSLPRSAGVSHPTSVKGSQGLGGKGSGFRWKEKAQPPGLVDHPSDYLTAVHARSSRNPGLARVQRGLLIYTERFLHTWGTPPTHFYVTSLFYPTPVRQRLFLITCTINLDFGRHVWWWRLTHRLRAKPVLYIGGGWLSTVPCVRFYRTYGGRLSTVSCVRLSLAGGGKALYLPTVPCVRRYIARGGRLSTVPCWFCIAQGGAALYCPLCLILYKIQYDVWGRGRCQIPLPVGRVGVE